MKTILLLFLVLTTSAIAFADSDYTLAPDGTYVSDVIPRLHLTGLMSDMAGLP